MKVIKRNLIVAVSLLFGIILVFNILALAGCSKAPKTAPTLTVVEENVRVDLESENYDIYKNVTAKDGNGKDINDRIQVKFAENVVVNDGKASFATTGDYKFEYSVDDGYGKTAVAEVNVAVRNIYSVYLTNATMPPFYCALDMAENGYKFIYFNDRTGTVDVTVYGERVLGNYKESQADYDAALGVFYNLYEEDGQSYFRIFMPDARNQNLIKYIVAKDIAEDRYEIKYLSDGAMSYNMAFPYRGDDAYEKWQTNSDIYNNFYNLAKENKELIYNGLTLGGDYLSYELHNAYILAAQKSNAEFWGAFPETLQSPDARVQAEIDKAHLIKKQPEVMYQNLTNEQQQLFLRSVSFDKAEFDRTYFNREGKYLIITGTNPVTGSFDSDSFIGLIDEIRNDYSGYNILFKPHPSSIPSETVFPEVYNYMTENEITILPGRLPMEVISWLYSDALIGGFDSSLYMSVPQGNTTFFIAENKNKLSAVSLMLYETGAFGDVDFYWVK